MSTETELKLSLAPTAVSALLRHPLLATTPKQQYLSNTYFDTDDLALTRQQVAVRERRIGEQTLLTVKTAGHSVGGLSQRREWEAPSQAGAFDFRALVDDAGLADALAHIADQLAPVFITDFERLSWRIQQDGSDVEIALDRGVIEATRQGRTARQPICELELELKSGNASALTMLAAQLASAISLTPLDDSKAARGYALLSS